MKENTVYTVVQEPEFYLDKWVIMTFKVVNGVMWILKLETIR